MYCQNKWYISRTLAGAYKQERQYKTIWYRQQMDLLSSVEHILQQTLLYSFPVNEAPAAVDALVRSDACT